LLTRCPQVLASLLLSNFEIKTRMMLNNKISCKNYSEFYFRSPEDTNRLYNKPFKALFNQGITSSLLKTKIS